MRRSGFGGPTSRVEPTWDGGGDGADWSGDENWNPDPANATFAVADSDTPNHTGEYFIVGTNSGATFNQSGGTVNSTVGGGGDPTLGLFDFNGGMICLTATAPGCWASRGSTPPATPLPRTTRPPTRC